METVNMKGTRFVIFAALLGARSHCWTPCGRGEIITQFDGHEIGETIHSFADLHEVYAGFVGVVSGEIEFNGFEVGTEITDQWQLSHGVVFSNVTGEGQVDGIRLAGGDDIEAVDGYDGTYQPADDPVLTKWPNIDFGSPLTMTFDPPVAAVGSFIGTGVEGIVDTVTIDAFDIHGEQLISMRVQLDLWDNEDNREGFWALRADASEIAAVTILNDNSHNFGNAVFIDTIQWNDQPSVPEPSTLVLGLLSLLSVLGRGRRRRSL
jgi:hypothetical protein